MKGILVNTTSSSLLGSLLVLATSGCVIGDPAPGGNADFDGPTGGPSGGTTDSAVGLLRSRARDGAVQLCTATLVGPSVMITAGACVDRGELDVSFDARPDLTAALGTRGYVRATLIANPAYTGNPADGHDVSVVQLATAASATPVRIGAAPVQGAVLRSVGYDQGTRRSLDVPVGAIAAHDIITRVGGACSVGTGGPLFDTAGALVATSSYGQAADCHHTRLDDNLDFLDGWVTTDDGDGDGGGSGGGNNQCHVNQNGHEIECVNGACICRNAGQQTGTCTAPDPSTACSSPGNCCGF